MDVPGYKINMLIPGAMKAVVDKAAADIIALRSGREIDAIAVTGTSGSLIGYAISSVTGIPVIYVRIENEQLSGKHHGYLVEGESPVRPGSVLFVDDFMSSGQSLKHVHDTLKAFFGVPMLCGVYMYGAEYGTSPYSVPSHVMDQMSDGFPALLSPLYKSTQHPSHAYLTSVIHERPAALFEAMRSIVDLLITTRSDGIAVCGKSGTSIASLLQYYHGVRVVHVRKSCDTTNHGFQVEGRPGLFPNHRVLFVDDLICSGATAAWTFQQLKRYGLDMVGIALYRHAGNWRGQITKRASPTKLYTVAGGVVVSDMMTNQPYSCTTHNIDTYEV